MKKNDQKRGYSDYKKGITENWNRWKNVYGKDFDSNLQNMVDRAITLYDKHLKNGGT